MDNYQKALEVKTESDEQPPAFHPPILAMSPVLATPNILKIIANDAVEEAKVASPAQNKGYRERKPEQLRPHTNAHSAHRHRNDEITIMIKNKSTPVVRNMMKKMAKTTPSNFNRIKISDSILKDKSRKSPHDA